MCSFIKEEEDRIRREQEEAERQAEEEERIRLEQERIEQERRELRKQVQSDRIIFRLCTLFQQFFFSAERKRKKGEIES